MDLAIIYSRRARRQLENLYDFIAADAGEQRADMFVGALTAYCDDFKTFPERGTRHPAIRRNMRTIGFRKRVTIVFEVRPKAVIILAIFYAGRDVARAL